MTGTPTPKQAPPGHKTKEHPVRNPRSVARAGDRDEAGPAKVDAPPVVAGRLTSARAEPESSAVRNVLGGLAIEIAEVWWDAMSAAWTSSPAMHTQQSRLANMVERLGRASLADVVAGLSAPTALDTCKASALNMARPGDVVTLAQIAATLDQADVTTLIEVARRFCAVGSARRGR